jgi:hypothetical protein
LLAATLLLAASAGAAAPVVGGYAGKTAAATPGAKPHSIVFKIGRGTCAPPLGAARRQGYCVTFSTASFVPALCAGSGFDYDAFFPVAEPMALSPAGRINAVFPLYVGDGEAFAAPASGRVKAGTFQLTLAVNGANATGTERFKANLGADDGVCDSGSVTISAQRG